MNKFNQVRETIKSKTKDLWQRFGAFWNRMFSRFRKPEERTPELPTFTIEIGTIRGSEHDLRRVHLKGKRLASRDYPCGYTRNTETLYETEDGRLLVHTRTVKVDEAGLPSSFKLEEISAEVLLQSFGALEKRIPISVAQFLEES